MTGGPLYVLFVVPSAYGPLALTSEEFERGLDRASEVRPALPSSAKRPDVASPQPTFLADAQTAAEMLGVKSSWLLQRAREGRIPHVRLGKYVRFDLEELHRAFRQSGDLDPTSESHQLDDYARCR